MSNTIWITGAGGLLGNYLVQTAPAFAPKNTTIIGLTRPQLELTDTTAVRDLFHRHQPELVIHCAALSHSTKCQADPPLARRLNVEMTQRLAELAANIRFVFFSTDLVFDGRVGNYDESAPSNPLSVYGQTKVEAERIVLANPRHTVVRTSINAGTSPTGDRGFDEQLHRAWQAGQMLRLFTDEFRSPIPAEATARAVWELVAGDHTGLYHVAGRARLSRWQIGQLLVQRWPDLAPKLQPASTKEYPGAPRPADSSLNCAKAQKLLSFRLPALSEWTGLRPELEIRKAEESTDPNPQASPPGE
jgi:dTDP-4-dehydrorhamnose reductase